jgi:NTP pyrophosphatase (non-canonical NTP hydrolase)
MNLRTENDFLNAFTCLQQETYATANKHGFQEHESNPLYVPTKLALIMSEGAEALEAHRQGKTEELGHELADIVIRSMDLAESLRIDLAAEILKKAAFNANRPFKHGNKLY